MITTSSGFKTAMKSSGRQLHAYLNDSGTYIRDTDDLISIKINAKGDIGKAVMRSAEVVYSGTHDYIGKWVKLGVGVVLPNTTTEYLDYGSFYVESVTYDKATLQTTAKLFDKMYLTLQPYFLDVTYPITMKAFLEAICTRLGLTLVTATFPNDDTLIDGEVFLNQGLTYRDVIDDIAEASGSIILFNNTDGLVIKQVSKVTGGVVDTLDSETLKSLELKALYGYINSVVLSRQPQEDNIADLSV